MFPRPVQVPRRRCRRCQKPTRVDRLIQGYGSDCAQRLGLTGGTVDVGQVGPTLLDLLNDEPEDECDGYDR